MSYKRFKNDLTNLDRHIDASINSLKIPADSPRYLLAARLRFCKFMDGMRSIEQLEWLTQRRDSDRILPTLLAIRNSDTFMEEIASRVDAMTREEVTEALQQGQTNMVFLRKVAAKLGYANSAADNNSHQVPVEEIMQEIGAESAKRYSKTQLR